MVKIRMTREERTRAFLDWYDVKLSEKGWRSEQVAAKGDFDSSVITNYRAGRVGVGQKVAERAARAFGLDDGQVLKLLQHLQLVPGGDDDAGEEDTKVASGWARKIARVEDEQERRRLIATVDLLIEQSIKATKDKPGAPADRRRPSRGALRQG